MPTQRLMSDGVSTSLGWPDGELLAGVADIDRGFRILGDLQPDRVAFGALKLALSDSESGIVGLVHHARSSWSVTRWSSVG